MNAKITKVFGATKSEKNGKFYLAAQATMSTGDSVLGTGVESNALVNIALNNLSETIASILTQDSANPNRYTATDLEGQALGTDGEGLQVTLRDVRPHAEKEGVYWATV